MWASIDSRMVWCLMFYENKVLFLWPRSHIFLPAPTKVWQTNLTAFGNKNGILTNMVFWEKKDKESLGLNLGSWEESPGPSSEVLAQTVSKGRWRVGGGWSLPLSTWSWIFGVWVAKDGIETNHLNAALVVACSPLVRKRKGQEIPRLVRELWVIWKHWNLALAEPCAASQSLKMESKCTVIAGMEPLSPYTPQIPPSIPSTLTSTAFKRKITEGGAESVCPQREQKQYVYTHSKYAGEVKGGEGLNLQLFCWM